MAQKLHHIIISLASNFNQEANLEAARTALTQLLTEAHFTSAKWTKPFGVIEHGTLNIDHSLEATPFESKLSSLDQCSMFNVQCSMFNGQCSMYLNQLCQGTTAFGPNLLSEVLKETEKRQGRTHNEDGIVTLDLDLLQYDDQRFHHRDWERSYVKDLINEL
ncbi:2-amino-4-hydroxy-6-hydroxymethyldihydropteridine diphosphokinase [Xylanibacter ruminicola]|nr:2-amino-4-hydroxy-6-hydroxymethyldihydropteridine diphosphokinase [Xylanibacter ruminicola]